MDICVSFGRELIKETLILYFIDCTKQLISFDFFWLKRKDFGIIKKFDYYSIIIYIVYAFWCFLVFFFIKVIFFINSITINETTIKTYKNIEYWINLNN